MGDRSKKEQFVEKIKKDKEILVDWFVNSVEKPGSNFADVIDCEAKLAFYLLDEKDMKIEEPILSLDGKIIFFTTSEGAGEVAFQPSGKSFIEFKDFNFGDKFGDDKTPQLWTMFLVNTIDGWTQLIPHNFSDIIDFSKDHTISIDKVNPRYVNEAVTMEVFAVDAADI